MAFRPNWYENESRRSRFSWSGPAQWSGVTFMLALIGAGFALQLVIDDRIGFYGALRAWWPSEIGGPKVFNLAFPIQILTYGFFHASFQHIFWNCFLLWMFGRELEASYGKRGFLRLYLGGVIAGGLMQWAYWLFTGDNNFVVGASGGVFALMVLWALKWPRRTIYLNFLFPVPVWVLVGAYVLFNVLDLVKGTAGSTSVLAHLGGAAFALLWFRRGDVVARVVVQRKRVKAERENTEHAADRREMDRILSKIQSSGLSSLDSRERSFLDRRSRELRQGRG